MGTGFIDAAAEFTEMAKSALADGRVVEGFSLLEMALTAAFMAKSATPISVKLWARTALPRRLASVDHTVVHLSRQGIVVYCDAEIVLRPLCELRRFSMVGAFLSNVAARLRDDKTYECVVDLGDGDDLGDYQRVAYSSARPDTLLVPDPALYMNDDYDSLRLFAARHAKPWRQRQDVVFWRGSAGGHRLRPPDPADALKWDWLQRLRLCAACRGSNFADKLDVGLTSHHQIGEEHWRDAIERAGFMRPGVPKQQFFEYRYQIDVDGWANAWSLLDKMIMGATILKVESALGFRQWYYDRLTPWETYVPVASDLTDLDERLAWVLSHSDEAECIAANAAAVAATIRLAPEMAQAETVVAAMLRPVN